MSALCYFTKPSKGKRNMLNQSDLQILTLKSIDEKPRLKVKRFGHVKTFYECDKINHSEFTSLLGWCKSCVSRPSSRYTTRVDTIPHSELMSFSVCEHDLHGAERRRQKPKQRAESRMTILMLR